MPLELDELKIREEVGASTLKAEQERTKAIFDLGKEYKAESLAAEYVQNGKPKEDFIQALLKEYGGQNGLPTSAKVNNEEVGLDEKEIAKFSLFNLAKALWNPAEQGFRKVAAFEFEACSAAADKYGDPKNGGQVLPLEIFKYDAYATRFMNATGDINTTLGSTLIPELTAIQRFIEILRNKTFVMSKATILPDLVGTVNIPNQTADMTGYWVGEDTAPTASQPTLSEVALAMKTVAARCRLTRSMAKQTPMAMESFLRGLLLATLGIQIDVKALYGDGTSNTPKGIKYLDGLNTTEFATQYQPTHAELVDMETQISLDNADVNNMAYMIDPNLRGHAKTTLKATGVAGYLWEPGNQINGYDTMVTNQVTKGDGFFGNWAELLVGMWGGQELFVDPYSESTKGALNLTLFQDMDIVARHAASFCFGSDNLTGTTGATA